MYKEIQETSPKVNTENEQPSNSQVSLDELDLTALFDVPILNEDEKDDKVEVKRKIQQAKRFYLDHFNYQVNLNHEAYVRLSGISDFGVGYRYKNLVEKMDKLELLTQLVNERYKIRTICKTMYYREASLKLDNKTNSDLLGKYLGLGVNDNKILVKQELKENNWFLKVYRDRLLFVTDQLKDRFSLDLEEIKLIRDYDDVLSYIL